MYIVCVNVKFVIFTSYWCLIVGFKFQKSITQIRRKKEIARKLEQVFFLFSVETHKLYSDVMGFNGSTARSKRRQKNRVNNLQGFGWDLVWTLNSILRDLCCKNEWHE